MNNEQSPLRLLHNLIEHFLGEPAPPPLSPDQLTLIVREAATVAAREAAREVISELLGKRRDLSPVPDSWVEPADAPADVEPLTVVPEPEPTPQAALETRLAESVAKGRAPATRSAETAEKDAAADLFISEHVVHAGPTSWLSIPELMSAYERWRPGIDAPEISKSILGLAMRRAGYAKVQAHSGIDAQFRVAPRPMLYVGAALRDVPAVAATEEPEAPKEPEPAPAWMASDTERKREDLANGYIGQWPGREIPNDFRNKVVVPVLRSGKGWVYKKANSNGAGKPRLISPEGQVFTLPNTPSDWRALKNTTASLRKLGAAL